MVYIGTIPHLSKGRVENITAQSLHHAKNALHWWATTLVPNFTSISSEWSQELTAYIHLVAEQFDLQSCRSDKHNLTDSELSLFYEVIMEKTDEDIDDNEAALRRVAPCILHGGSSRLHNSMQRL